MNEVKDKWIEIWRSQFLEPLLLGVSLGGRKLELSQEENKRIVQIFSRQSVMKRKNETQDPDK